METPGDPTAFLKAMADVKRIKIAGVVADGPLSLEEIASRLDLNLAEVTGHVQRLLAAGLLRATTSQTYILDRARIEAMARNQFAKDATIHYVVDAGLTDEEKRLIAGYMTPDGKLEQIPMQSKKLRVALKYALALLDLGRRYTEKELNTELARINPDTATLRRGLVDQGDLLRKPDGSLYWRAVPEAIERTS